MKHQFLTFCSGSGNYFGSFDICLIFHMHTFFCRQKWLICGRFDIGIGFANTFVLAYVCVDSSCNIHHGYLFLMTLGESLVISENSTYRMCDTVIVVINFRDLFVIVQIISMLPWPLHKNHIHTNARVHTRGEPKLYDEWFWVEEMNGKPFISLHDSTLLAMCVCVR